ncbi:MAG TPA: glycerol-3-phosphate dehydrogenase C-terminal domain-containing protein, partial [Acidimicrobiales bacterium]|nr:glycerol-3-phosphate dehydrogenase C-terminal domain-containing protein [Acidimicrobiales bacterium]
RTADMSRRHTVRVSKSGMVTVTGGKLTTYRRMAEDTVDAVVRRLGSQAPAGADRCRTRRLALRGAGGLDEVRAALESDATGVDADARAALVMRHGSEATDVLALAGGRTALLEPLVAGMPQLKVEAVWAARHEMALTVDDVLARRTRAVLRHARPSAEAAAGIGALLAPEWGRSPDMVADEAAAFAAQARRDLERAGLDPAARSEAPPRGDQSR